MSTSSAPSAPSSPSPPSTSPPSTSPPSTSTTAGKTMFLALDHQIPLDDYFPVGPVPGYKKRKAPWLHELQSSSAKRARTAAEDAVDYADLSRRAGEKMEIALERDRDAAEIVQLHALLREKEDALESAAAEKKALEGRLADAISQHSTFQQQLTADRSAVEQAFSVANARYEHACAERGTLQTATNALRAENEALRSASDSLRAENETLRAAAHSSRVEIDALRAANASSRVEIETLGAANQSARVENDQLRADSKSVRAANTSLRAKSEQFRAACASLSQQVAAAELTAGQQEQRALAAEAETRTVVKELQDAQLDAMIMTESDASGVRAAQRAAAEQEQLAIAAAEEKDRLARELEEQRSLHAKAEPMVEEGYISLSGSLEEEEMFDDKMAANAYGNASTSDEAVFSRFGDARLTEAKPNPMWGLPEPTPPQTPPASASRSRPTSSRDSMAIWAAKLRPLGQ